MFFQNFFGEKFFPTMIAFFISNFIMVTFDMLIQSPPFKIFLLTKFTFVIFLFFMNSLNMSIQICGKFEGFTTKRKNDKIKKMQNREIICFFAKKLKTYQKSQQKSFSVISWIDFMCSFSEYFSAKIFGHWSQ